MRAQPRTRCDVEQDITTARKAYLRALNAGHDGECEAYEQRIDDLFTEWKHTPEGRR